MSNIDFLSDIPVDLVFSTLRALYLLKPCRTVIEESSKAEKLMQKIKVARGKITDEEAEVGNG